MATTPLGNMTAEQRDQWVEALVNPVGYHQCHGAWADKDDEGEPGYCCLTVLAIEVLGLDPNAIAVEGDGDSADFSSLTATEWLEQQLGRSFNYIPFTQRNDGAEVEDRLAPDLKPRDEDDLWSYDEIAEFIRRLPLATEPA